MGLYTFCRNLNGIMVVLVLFVLWLVFLCCLFFLINDIDHGDYCLNYSQLGIVLLCGYICQCLEMFFLNIGEVLVFSG